MKPENFTVWLDGYLTAAGHTLTNEQVQIIKEKLDSVFNKITPTITTTTPNTYDTTWGGYYISGVKPGTFYPTISC